MTSTTELGYADVFQMYTDLGWSGVLKLKAGSKFPPPTGFTGAAGAYPSYADMHAWAEEEPAGNVALRLGDGFIGIDEDRYNGKTGQATIAEAEKRWGALPYSPKSTSRTDGSGIRLYRVPAGLRFAGVLEFPDLDLGDVEIIQPHHRYAVVWPSVHDKTGQRYYWHDADGEVITPPHSEAIPELPAAWVEALRESEKPSSSSGLDPEAPYNVRQALTEGEPSRRVSWRLGEAIVACQGGSRHDTTRDHVLGLLRYGKQGDLGVLPALKALKAAFIAAVGPDRVDGPAEAAREFDKFIISDRTARLLADDSYDQTEGAAESAAGPPAALGATLLTRTALRELPDPEPLIDNVLDQGTVALLYGRWGTGKSFVALDWAASVGTGRNWQGRPTRQRRVLYVAAEGAYGLKGRLDAWEAGWQTRIADGQLDILPRPVNLTRGRDAAELAALIETNGYGLVVLDTLARCMVGADENSAKDCGEVVDALVRLREHTAGGRGVIVGVHHTGKDGKTFRGSSVFEAGADTVYALGRDDGVITLDREKRKDGPQGDRHLLKINPIAGSGSCVISATSGVASSPRAEALLATFRQHFATTGASKTELRKVSDLSDGTFYRAVSDLVQSGDLVNEGTDRRPFYRAVQP